MKRVLLIFTILFVSVVSTACINNLAVQDLNNKALAYMEQGDFKQAIERFKSSLDLDDSVFETHYNLAVAYTQNEEYIEAFEQYKKALEIQPQKADVYYSLATAEFNFATDLKQGKLTLNSDNTISKPEDENQQEKLPEETNSYISQLYDASVENYRKYLELNPKAKEKDEINKQIENINKMKEEQ